MSVGLADAALPPSITVLERGWLSSNSVLLLDGASATLIDSGYDSHAQQTVALVRHALDGRALRLIANTHLHSDHCGGNAALRRAFDAPIAIPPGQADAVRVWDAEALSHAATAQRCEPFNYDQLLHPGQSLIAGELEWRILSAPGHDPHSIVLWNESHRILISADALWENGFGAIFPELQGESGFAEQQALLDLFEQLAPRFVIPGHGAVFTDAPAAIERARRRLHALQSSPQRNARHVAKVLVKFLLMDVRRIGFTDLVQRLAGASYLQRVNQRFYRLEFSAFVRAVVDDLTASAALRWDAEEVVNCCD